MKILILSSLAYSLINFRGDLLKAMIDHDHTVIACAPDYDADTERKLAELGAEFRHTPMQRTGTNALSDMRLILRYGRLIRREKPDVVLAYTQKPIIYGGISARFFGGESKPQFFALMSGLGQMFSVDSGYSRALQKAVARLYRFGLARARSTFVFNSDDREDMIELGILNKRQRVIQVPGSGVLLDRFPPCEPMTTPVRFLMIGRLMRNKGIMEFLEASKTVRAKYPECEFRFVGRCEDENPAGISRQECQQLAANYGVEFVPGTDDVRPYLADSSVFVLPSYYREGLPRTILEALASARPVITTNLPGCRDAVEDGVNGYLIRPRDAGALASAMIRFAERKELIIKMGNASLAIARDRYDVHKVNRQLLLEMNLLRIAAQEADAKVCIAVASAHPEHAHAARRG